MERISTGHSWVVSLTNVLAVLLFGILAFLLGCFEMTDTDIWWHLAGGEWILQNGRVPDLDPFSFGSADQRWIDLHWLFQVILALVHRGGGIPGVMILGATAGTAAFMTALAMRPGIRLHPGLFLLLLPALALASSRFNGRPEMFTLLFLAVYLAVLANVEDHPRLVWILPGIQLLWVNMHSLFIFGPIILGLWWLAWIARVTALRWKNPAFSFTESWRSVRQLALGSGLVILCCLLNPYGVEGALFPLTLYPKIGDIANPYKLYIDEFMSPYNYAILSPAYQPMVRFRLDSLHCLLLLVPVSFLLPAIWSAFRPRQSGARPSGSDTTAERRLWLGVLLVSVLLVLAHVIAFRNRDDVNGQMPPVNLVAFLMLAMGVVGGWLLRRAFAAALLSVCGATAIMTWSLWLGWAFSADSSFENSRWLLIGIALTGAISVGLVLWHGGSLFQLLLAIAFGYLAFQAINSFARFALVAGLVISWNLCDWIGRLVADPTVAGRRLEAWVMRLGEVGLLIGCIVGVVGGQYSRMLNWENRVVLHETPHYYAHEASRFAGQAGLPRHALVFGVATAGIYVYHNGPQSKVYMDARLEVPTLETFRNYVEIENLLQANDKRWAARVEQLGNPLLMLSHGNHYQAEAAVLVNPGYRLIYFDAMAAVFIPRDSSEMERRFPTYSPLDQHFRGANVQARVKDPVVAWRECWACYHIGRSLRSVSSEEWVGRAPWFLSALDRVEVALADPRKTGRVWGLAGFCHQELMPDHRRPSSPREPWNPVNSLSSAQATYCFLQALQHTPKDQAILEALIHSYGVRRMADAQRGAGIRLLSLTKPSADKETFRRRLDRIRPLPVADARRGADVSAVVLRLLQEGRPEQATRLAEDFGPPPGKSGWAWPVADRLAGAWMHLGQPREAREVWRSAIAVPSHAIQLARMGSTYWVERDLDEAVRLYRQALASKPRLIEAGWALAWLHTQRGEAGPALRACQKTLKLNLPSQLSKQLRELEILLLSAHRER